MSGFTSTLSQVTGTKVACSIGFKSRYDYSEFDTSVQEEFSFILLSFSHLPCGLTLGKDKMASHDPSINHPKEILTGKGEEERENESRNQKVK